MCALWIVINPVLCQGARLCALTQELQVIQSMILSANAIDLASHI